jgi:peptidoglycan hydrolase-like protein with peptidoglycan-binding domain
MGQELLKLGSSGPAVSSLQTTLAMMGYDTGGVDGKFGPKTDAAVRRFQTAAGLTADGIVGPNTWRSLTNGSTDDKVTIQANEYPAIFRVLKYAKSQDFDGYLDELGLSPGIFGGHNPQPNV